MFLPCMCEGRGHISDLRLLLIDGAATSFGVVAKGSPRGVANQGSANGGFQTVARVLSGHRIPVPPLNLN